MSVAVSRKTTGADPQLVLVAAAHVVNVPEAAENMDLDLCSPSVSSFHHV